jgi:hypothetical protein
MALSFRLILVAIFTSFFNKLVDSACVQGQPATCTYPYGNTATSSSTNKVNPCIDYYEMVGLATGYQNLVASQLLHQLSEPSPSTFCYNYYCGPNAGTDGTQSTQTFNGSCAEGYFGTISATCVFRANCWYAGNFGSIRGLLMYNLGANQASATLGGRAALAGQCSAATTSIYTTTAAYVGLDASSGNGADPVFAYTPSCSACPLGYSCNPGTLLSTDAVPCPPGFFCPGGKKQACPGGTFAFGSSTTRTSVNDCTPCSSGSYSEAGSGTCSPCPAGTFGPNNGAGVCLPCPAGTLSTATGQNSSSTCTACPANLFSFSGSSSCLPCPSGTTFLSASIGCAFVDNIVAKVSGLQFDGVLQFANVQTPGGITYTTNQFGSTASAMTLALGSYASTTFSTTASFTTFPSGNNVPMSLVTFVKCPAFSSAASATVVEWGIPSPSTSSEKFSISVLGSGISTLPGPVAGVCDNKWHHIAQVLGDDGVANSLKRYVDGALVSSAIINFAIPATGNAFRIGWNGGRGRVFFSTPGSTTWTVPAGVTSVNLLIVGGGGGGGGSADRTAGGGGAGGFRCLVNVPVTPGSTIPITVGNGGNGGAISGTQGSKGGDSIFGTYVSLGGGGGGGAPTASAAISGGSGGGVFHGLTTNTAGLGTSGQGFNGGPSGFNSGVGTGVFSASGGGGASGPGLSGTVSRGGAGGPGAQCPSVDGRFFAGGGGGVAQSMGGQGVNAGPGGIGGGGDGAKSTAQPTILTGSSGVPATGGGGGGGGVGGAGGSGFVGISYITSDSTLIDQYTGSLADAALYSRALTATEVLKLASPPLVTIAGSTTPTLSSTATTYTYPPCAAGYSGTSTLVWTKSATDNSWSSTGATSCTICPSGTYSTSAGSSSCIGTACIAGKFGPLGSTTLLGATCSSCPAGTFTSASGSGLCIPCVPGTYSTSIDSITCAGTPCTTGFFGPEGQTSSLTATCTSCAAGTYGSGLSCLPCPAGSYSASTGATSSIACQPCAGSTYSLGGAASCASCPSGMTFVSSTSGCTPSIINGPSDIVFALSGAETGVFPYVTGTPTQVTNQIGTSSFAFNFSNAYIGTIPSTPVTYNGFPIGTSAMSASAWVNCPSFTSQAQSSIFEWGSPALATSVLKFSLSALGSAGQSLPGPSSGLCDGKWHHVAQIYQGGTNGVLTRYIDGSLQTTASTTYAIPQIGSAIRVGWNGGASASVYSTPGVTSWTVPAGVTSVNVLVVGGGGGGGGSSDRTAGGGGAGGFRCVANVPVIPGQVYGITVGNGGAGGSGGAAGGLGGTSAFGSVIVSNGGGGGGGNSGAASSGGSGGGKFHGATAFVGTGIAGQGFGGGLASYDSGQGQGTFTASGGGGASTRGFDGTMFGGGNGGVGARCLSEFKYRTY